LLNQRIVEFAPALVGGKFLVPVGGHLQCVPCDEHGARLLVSIEPEEQIGKAENGTGRLAAAPQNCFRQGVVGAMGE
jgi:hypothetical protein